MKPAFWSDAKVAELPEATRLFYIGLWMIADDAGWLRWEPSEVARDLYGYEGRARRERRTAAMFDQLVTAKRVVLHPCGHAEVPKLSAHQHLGGSTKQIRTSFNEHLKGCVSPSPADARDDPRMPAEARIGNGKERVMVRNGKERSGQSTAHAPDGARLEEETEFSQRVPRPQVVRS